MSRPRRRSKSTGRPNEAGEPTPPPAPVSEAASTPSSAAPSAKRRRRRSRRGNQSELPQTAQGHPNSQPEGQGRPPRQREQHTSNTQPEGQGRPPRQREQHAPNSQAERQGRPPRQRKQNAPNGQPQNQGRPPRQREQHAPNGQAERQGQALQIQGEGPPSGQGQTTGRPRRRRSRPRGEQQVLEGQASGGDLNKTTPPNSRGGGRSRSERAGTARPSGRVTPRTTSDQRGRASQRFRPTQRPRLPIDDFQTRSQPGEFGESWWAQRWINVLESFGFSSRLNRGRSYARSGAVLTIEVHQGRVIAYVQGSRSIPYKVVLSVIPLSNAQWERAIDAMADQAIFTARLLAGEMPREIEQAFATARVSLFPQSVHDIQTECSCPDYAVPCKHIVAVAYLLGERFDEDPFLVFELRGRSKEKIIAGLRARRADTTSAAPLPSTPARDVPTLAELLVGFDQPGPELEQIAPQVVAPAVASTMLRRYGPSPVDTTNDLHAAYLLMSRATLDRLFAEE